MGREQPAYAFCQELARLKQEGQHAELAERWNKFVDDCQAAGRPVQWHHILAVVDTMDSIKREVA
jgi:hypothetical protein